MNLNNLFVVLLVASVIVFICLVLLWTYYCFKRRHRSKLPKLSPVSNIKTLLGHPAKKVTRWNYLAPEYLKPLNKKSTSQATARSSKTFLPEISKSTGDQNTHATQRSTQSVTQQSYKPEKEKNFEEIEEKSSPPRTKLFSINTMSSSINQRTYDQVMQAQSLDPSVATSAELCEIMKLLESKPSNIPKTAIEEKIYESIKAESTNKVKTGSHNEAYAKTNFELIAPVGNDSSKGRNSAKMGQIRIHGGHYERY